MIYNQFNPVKHLNRQGLYLGDGPGEINPSGVQLARRVSC